MDDRPVGHGNPFPVGPGFRLGNSILQGGSAASRWTGTQRERLTLFPAYRIHPLNRIRRPVPLFQLRNRRLDRQLATDAQ